MLLTRNMPAQASCSLARTTTIERVGVKTKATICKHSFRGPRRHQSEKTSLWTYTPINAKTAKSTLRKVCKPNVAATPAHKSFTHLANKTVVPKQAVVQANQLHVRGRIGGKYFELTHTQRKFSSNTFAQHKRFASRTVVPMSSFATHLLVVLFWTQNKKCNSKKCKNNIPSVRFPCTCQFVTNRPVNSKPTDRLSKTNVRSTMHHLSSNCVYCQYLFNGVVVHSKTILSPCSLGPNV